MQKLRRIYSTLLILAGLVVVVLGVVRFPTYNDPLVLFLLLVLAIAVQSTMTPLVSDTVSVSVSGAISFATIGLYEPVAAAMVAGIAELGLWMVLILTHRRHQKKNWRLEGERLGVNVGIHSVSILTAGFIFYLIQNWFGINTFLGKTLPWLIGAIVADQVNFWLLAGIVYLANGVKPIEIWRQNRWAVPMNILVLAIGGGLIFLAVSQFGLLGLAIFILPIVLSAYTFRLTVNNTKKQMETLEEQVAARTHALADANEKLEELHKEKNAFLAVLTHDMRTPLTSIKGYASILRDRDLPRNQQEKIARVILHSQDTLLDIVNNILELEKLESGKAPVLLESTNFDLALLTKVSADSLKAQAVEKNISLEYDTVPSPIMLTADMNKIQRVILNLISNAIKYTPENGRVQVRAYTNGRNALVEVQDTGYGIPEDELPTIFDRYSRVQSHRRLAIGTGLGLAIVKSLVDAHNGEITVTSKENEGSTFTVKLPLVQN
ncbi:MAG TPA: HAMP domain-containing histidine kinase [Chloroflexi bacterium]|nr:HAMP domain-containing histidine kinase [Chloroflexota bacterium]